MFVEYLAYAIKPRLQNWWTCDGYYSIEYNIVSAHLGEQSHGKVDLEEFQKWLKWSKPEEYNARRM